jgi:phosphoribosylformylglycinamidine synthase
MKQATYYVEIRLKETLFDAFGADIKNSIHELGITGIREVKVVELYRLDGAVTKQLASRIARELLLDPVSQKMKLALNVGCTPGWTAVVVWYKKGVTDPVAFTAQKGIIDLGIKSDISVSCGRKYEFKGTARTEEIDYIARTILANVLIQDYAILPSHKRAGRQGNPHG